MVFVKCVPPLTAYFSNLMKNAVNIRTNFLNSELVHKTLLNPLTTHGDFELKRKIRKKLNYHWKPVTVIGIHLKALAKLFQMNSRVARFK